MKKKNYETLENLPTCKIQIKQKNLTLMSEGGGGSGCGPVEKESIYSKKFYNQCKKDKKDIESKLLNSVKFGNTETVEEIGFVTDAKNKLRNNIGKFNQTITLLEEKLKPILSPEEVNLLYEKIPREVMSQLSTDLYNYEEELDNMNSYLVGIIRRIEL